MARARYVSRELIRGDSLAALQSGGWRELTAQETRTFIRGVMQIR